MPASPDFTPPTRIDDQPELGEIKINHAVVASIARLAALNVEGVAAVGGGLADGLSELFAKRESESRGVRVVEEPSGAYALELRIAVTFGTEIGKTAYETQMAVRRQVIAMTGNDVSRVDIIIEGVRLPNANTRSETNDEAWPDAPATD